MTAEDRPVRERLAEVLAKQCGCTELTSDRPDIEAHLEDADAILSDADLLDDLCRERLEQVKIERSKAAVLRAKVAMYEGWLREHHPDCPLLVENIVSVHRGRTDG